MTAVRIMRLDEGAKAYLPKARALALSGRARGQRTMTYALAPGVTARFDWDNGGATARVWLEAGGYTNWVSGLDPAGEAVVNVSASAGATEDALAVRVPSLGISSSGFSSVAQPDFASDSGFDDYLVRRLRGAVRSGVTAWRKLIAAATQGAFFDVGTDVTGQLQVFPSVVHVFGTGSARTLASTSFWIGRPEVTPLDAYEEDGKLWLVCATWTDATGIFRLARADLNAGAVPEVGAFDGAAFTVTMPFGPVRLPATVVADGAEDDGREKWLVTVPAGADAAVRWTGSTTPVSAVSPEPGAPCPFPDALRPLVAVTAANNALNFGHYPISRKIYHLEIDASKSFSAPPPARAPIDVHADPALETFASSFPHAGAYPLGWLFQDGVRNSQVPVGLGNFDVYNIPQFLSGLGIYEPSDAYAAATSTRLFGANEFNVIESLYARETGAGFDSVVVDESNPDAGRHVWARTSFAPGSIFTRVDYEAPAAAPFFVPRYRIAFAPPALSVGDELVVGPASSTFDITSQGRAVPEAALQTGGYPNIQATPPPPRYPFSALGDTSVRALLWCKAGEIRVAIFDDENVYVDNFAGATLIDVVRARATGGPVHYVFELPES